MLPKQGGTFFPVEAKRHHLRSAATSALRGKLLFAEMGYGEAPWIFKGRALYQLQLVKTEEARRHIPENFQLVELFGYTLGGFYLARYDDSPVGAFNELVALAGLVWNAPTSCAWAARVYVDNRNARDHGLKSVGLPSRLARFSAAPPCTSLQEFGSRSHKANWWWQNHAAAAGAKDGPQPQQPGKLPDLCISNIESAAGRNLQAPICSLQLPQGSSPGAWPGPRIRLALPSFSGGTPEYPSFIQYACDLLTNVRLVPAAVVSVPGTDSGKQKDGRPSTELMSAVLGGRPVLALAFEDMVMSVEEPVVLAALQQRTRSSPSRSGLLGMIPAWGSSSS